MYEPSTFSAKVKSEAGLAPESVTPGSSAGEPTVTTPTSGVEPPAKPEPTRLPPPTPDTTAALTYMSAKEARGHAADLVADARETLRLAEAKKSKYTETDSKV